MRHIAILIDGGFLLKRLPALLKIKSETLTVEKTQKSISKLIFNHLIAHSTSNNRVEIWSTLYRSFYYDAMPYTERGHSFITKRAINYGKSGEALFRLELFEALKKMPSMALRLGEIQKGDWKIKPAKLKELQDGNLQFSELSDDDFTLGFRQKAVDMRIGMDMTSLALKKQVDTIVLVTGDADFIPVAKLARREGIKLVLDPLWRSVSDGLYEHIDELRSGLPRPK